MTNDSKLAKTQHETSNNDTLKKKPLFLKGNETRLHDIRFSFPPCILDRSFGGELPNGICVRGDLVQERGQFLGFLIFFTLLFVELCGGYMDWRVNLTTPKVAKTPIVRELIQQVLEVEIHRVDWHAIGVGNLASCSVSECIVILRIVKVEPELVHKRFYAGIQHADAVCNFLRGTPAFVKMGVLLIQRGQEAIPRRGDEGRRMSRRRDTGR